MQYWISTEKFTRLAKLYGNYQYVTTTDLTLNVGDVRIIVDIYDQTIAGEEIVYKASEGWVVLEVHYYFFPMPLCDIFTDEEIGVLNNIKSTKEITQTSCKKITQKTYQLVQKLQELLFFEKTEVNSSRCYNRRRINLRKAQQIQHHKETIFQLQLSETHHLIDFINEDYLKQKPAEKPPLEIKYYLPNHGEKRRKRRKPRN